MAWNRKVVVQPGQTVRVKIYSECRADGVLMFAVNKKSQGSLRRVESKEQAK